MRSVLRSIRRFLSELRRRNVYQVGLAYLVVGFAIVELADIAAGAFDLPGWFEPLVWVLCALGFPIALVLAWAFEVVPEEEWHRAPTATASDRSPDGPESPTAEEARGPEAQTGARPEKSVAVLPFTDMSREQDHEYFGDGLAEEVLNALTQLEDLRVAARTSSFAYRGTDADVREVGEKLRVATVLEGSVRRVDDRLRVTAQLTDTETGYHLWSETFDRELEEVFAIQEEITASIVEALQVELLGEEASRLSRVGTDDPEAYDLYLKGRDYWHRSRYEVGLDKALEFFEQALEEDPNFALAHAGVADVCWVLGIYGMAEPTALRRRADQASRRAVELEPDSLFIRAAVGLGHIFGGQYEEAARTLDRVLEENPTSVLGLHARAIAYGQQGRQAPAIELLEEAVSLADRASFVLALLGAVRGRAGQREEALGVLGELETRADQNGKYVPPLFFAFVEAHVGRRDEALAHLEKHWEARHPGMYQFVPYGLFDELEGEPRFERILEEMEVA